MSFFILGKVAYNKHTHHFECSESKSGINYLFVRTFNCNNRKQKLRVAFGYREIKVIRRNANSEFGKRNSELMTPAG